MIAGRYPLQLRVSHTFDGTVDYGDINKVFKANGNDAAFPMIQVANKHLAVGASFDAVITIV